MAPWVVLARHATITTDNKTSAQTGRSLVWDLPLRLFHWLLALSVTASWITAEAGYDWTEIHFLLGYCALTLISFRIIWGFVGTTHARFATFIRSPKNVFAALTTLFSRQPGDSVGHNPIGGWSTILFITLVAVQAGTGLFISDDIFYAGPYNGTISNSLAGNLAAVHHTNIVLLQIAVVIHLLAICWYTLGKRTKLIAPMFSGKKDLSEAQRSSAIDSSKLVKALLVLTIVVVLVTLLVQLAPAPSLEDYY